MQGASGWRPPNPQMVHFALTENGKVSSIASLINKDFCRNTSHCVLRRSSFASLIRTAASGHLWTRNFEKLYCQCGGYVRW